MAGRRDTEVRPQRTDALRRPVLSRRAEARDGMQSSFKQTGRGDERCIRTCCSRCEHPLVFYGVAVGTKRERIRAYSALTGEPFTSHQCPKCGQLFSMRRWATLVDRVSRSA